MFSPFGISRCWPARFGSRENAKEKTENVGCHLSERSQPVDIPFRLGITVIFAIVLLLVLVVGLVALVAIQSGRREWD